MLTAKVKELLNLFSKTQPALRDTAKPDYKAGVNLGDELDNLTKMTVQSGRYRFSTMGGAVGVISTGLSLPANAIITRVVTRSNVAFASGGLATVAIKAGAQTLKAATAFDSVLFTGVDVQFQSDTVTPTAPILVAADCLVTITIAVAALTDGDMSVHVEYIKP